MHAPNPTRVVAVYDVAYFDYHWREIEVLRAIGLTAHEMVAEHVEEWNRLCQLEARNNDILVISPELPNYITIEVRYVQVKKT